MHKPHKSYICLYSHGDMDGCGMDLCTQLWVSATSQPGSSGGRRDRHGRWEEGKCVYLNTSIPVHSEFVHTQTHSDSYTHKHTLKCRAEGAIRHQLSPFMFISNGAPLSLCGEQPIVLATACIVWQFPWDSLGQQFN